jgi:hypothetical protein
MSFLFESKKTEPEVKEVADPYKDVRNSLTGWLSGQVGKTGPTYTGELVAPMSGYENQSLGWLQDYANSGPSEMRTLAENEVKKTLSGSYDPTTSSYYQAVKAEAAKNLKDTQKSIADEAAGGGRYWSGARLGKQGDASVDTTNKLNEVIGSLADKERDRMTNSVSIADTLANESEQSSLKKAAALQTYGALPRTLSQAYDDATLNQWTKANYDYPLAIGNMAAGQLGNMSPVYGQVGYQPSVASSLASWLSPVASSAINAYGNIESSKNKAANTGIDASTLLAMLPMMAL